MSIIFSCELHSGSLIGVSVPENLLKNKPSKFQEHLRNLEGSELICTKQSDCCKDKYSRIYDDFNGKLIFYSGYGENQDIERFCRYIRNYLNSPHSSKIRMERLQSANGKTFKNEFNQIAKWQEYRCYFCFRELGTYVAFESGRDIGTIAHWDHLKPISRGGTEFPSNMALVCIKCNLEKGKKTESEYWKYLEKSIEIAIIRERRAFHQNYRKEKTYLSRRRKNNA